MLSWDEDGLYWDGDLIWDNADAGDIPKYLGLVTNRFNQKPNFMTMLAAIIGPLAGTEAVLNNMPTLFDIDSAVGVQLDILGMWIGRTRNLKVPITGVYFTYNTGPGYNSGIYKGPFDPVSGLVSLPDPQYRTYLKAVIASNRWNGTLGGAYAAYQILLDGTPFVIFIYDYQDMSISYALIGGIPDALTLALFTGGYLSLKPMGVRIRDYVVPVVAGPVFAYNLAASDLTAGYNVGHYAKRILA